MMSSSECNPKSALITSYSIASGRPTFCGTLATNVLSINRGSLAMHRLGWLACIDWVGSTSEDGSQYKVHVIEDSLQA